MALVITIIILIILSTITINAMFGENGLINLAQNAKNDAESTTQSESDKMNRLLEEYANIMAEAPEMPTIKPEESEDGVIVPVPIGFVMSKATGENKVSDGLVIYEGTQDVTNANVEEAKKTRDQFVWIPDNGENYLSSEDSNMYDIDSKIEEENKLINESIKKYGGFFISRYEIASDNNKFISKQGFMPDTNITLQEAINNSRSMYTRNDIKYGATSTLIYGKQWNILMNALNGKYDLKDSSNYGNYYNFNMDNIKIADRGKNHINYRLLKNYNYQFKMQPIVLATIGIESNADNLNPVVNSNGENFVLNYNIKLKKDSSDAYVRFKVIDNGTVTDVQVEENSDIIKKGDYYYYKIPLTTSKELNTKITFKAMENSSLETVSKTLKIQADAIQKSNFEPDFSLDDPWHGEGPNKQAKLQNKIIRVSDFKIDDEIELAYLGNTDNLNINVTIKPNTIKTTGSSSYWKVQNIYDLAGNIEEWTIDKESEKYVTRGGKYYEKSGKETPINSSNLVERISKSNDIGYRAILYIK